MGSFPIYHRGDYWKIYYEVFANGESVSRGTWHQSYKYKSSAVRRARLHFDNRSDYNPMTNETYTYKWIVSQSNPWAE